MTQPPPLPAQGWQPMDTMPSEGQVLVCWSTDEYNCIGRDEYLEILGFGETPAKAWMLLPSPPTPTVELKAALKDMQDCTHPSGEVIKLVILEPSRVERWIEQVSALSAQVETLRDSNNKNAAVAVFENERAEKYGLELTRLCAELDVKDQQLASVTQEKENWMEIAGERMKGWNEATAAAQHAEQRITELEQEKANSAAEVEHWVGRYNELENWRIQTRQRAETAEAHLDQLRAYVQRVRDELRTMAVECSRFPGVPCQVDSAWHAEAYLALAGKLDGLAALQGSGQ